MKKGKKGTTGVPSYSTRLDMLKTCVSDGSPSGSQIL